MAEDDENYVQEEEVTNIPGWTPSVSLQVNDVVATGEEGEDEIYSQKSKLYRFKDGEWKERGLGQAKLLKDKESGKIRFMLRQEKTEKIVANHYVLDYHPYCDLQPNAGSEKCWVWTTQDFAEDEKVVEQFALKFGSKELAQAFKEAFDSAKANNAQVGLGKAEMDGSIGSKAPEAVAPAGVESTTKPAAQTPDPPPPEAAPQEGAGYPGQPANDNEQVPNPFAGMSMFGASSGGGLFGTGGGLFGGAASSGSGLFSSAVESSNASTGGGLFSGGLFSGNSSGGGLFGGSAASTGGLFGSVASAGGLFGGASADPPKAEEAGEDDEYVQEEEVTVIPGWQASVSLELTEVENGEENEEELYCQRSKLLRFRDGEWKERGLGNAKLLKSKATGKVRFLLRQEKTEKVVANHFVVDHPPYCDLQPNAGSDKIWVWSVPMDYSEEEPEPTRFALKFGNPELAKEFFTAFENAKKINGDVGDMPAGGAETSKSPKASPKASPKPSPKSSPQPAKTEAPESSDQPNPFAGVSLFAPSSGGGLFDSMASSGGSLFSNSSSSSSAPAAAGSGGGIFGANTGGGLFSGNTGGGLFGGNTGGGLFGGGESSGGLFGGVATGGLFTSSAPSSGGLFSGGLGSTSGSAAAGGEATQAQEEDDYVVEEEVTNIPGWTPSVSLEVKDSVEMGEENEDELYCQRSKLYRFRDHEWKERGLGNAKLLKDKQSGKVRFMLRQEKTGKIVANHYVLDVPPLCDLKPNADSEKFWVWMAQDCAEETVETEQLALKFGSKELADKFKEAFDNAKQLNSQVPEFQSVVKGGSAGATAATSAVPAATSKASPPKPEANGGAQAAPAEDKAAPFSSLSFSAPSSGGMFSSFNTGGGLFGNSSGGGGLFGGSSESSGGLFGGGSSASSGGLFGGSSASSGGLFSGGSAGGLFGGNSDSSGGLFGGSAVSSGGLFSNTSSEGGLFSSPTPAGGLFGGMSSSAAPTSGLWGSAAAATTSTDGAANGAQDNDDYVVEEEVTTIPGWTPSVNLEVKDYVETGEEMEQELYSQRSKLLRFVDGEWKERGTGDAKILRHTESGLCRFLMRQEKTSKVVANHRIIDQAPYCDLVHNAGNEKIWVWTALDWADDEQKVEKFALRFKTEELAGDFAKIFNKAKSGATEEGDWNEDEEDGDDNQQEEDEWVQAESFNSGGGAFSLAAMAQQQDSSGWRCPGCRLQWGEKVLECSVCEIPRPGFEEQAAAAKADQEKGKQNAAAAFLGSSSTTAPSATGFGQSSEGSSAPISFGFGSGAPAQASGSLFGAPQSSGSSLFGAISSQSSGSSLFGGASAGAAPSAAPSLFQPATGQQPTQQAAADAGGAPTSIFGTGGAPTSIFGTSKASPKLSPKAAPVAAPSSLQLSPQQKPAPAPADVRPPTPPPPTATAMPGGGFGCGPCGYPGQQFGVHACMPQMGMPGAMGMMGCPAPQPTTYPPEAYQAMIAAMQAMTNSQSSKASPSGASEAALQSVEDRLRKMETAMRNQEARCDDAENRAQRAEACAKRTEQEVEGLKHELSSLKLKQQEDSQLIRRTQQKCDEQLQEIDALKQKLKKEQELREALDVAHNGTKSTAKSALEVANSALQTSQSANQAVLQLREERNSGLSSAHTAVDALERRLEELKEDVVHLKAVEEKVSKELAPNYSALARPEAAERISYFSGLHAQRTGGRLSLSNQDEPRQTLVSDRSPKPLLRTRAPP
eukprot:TRINITY_DN15459_c0_g1_i1.p1 TRINITY_DN15459_c0_g1~~TRINITY_DN15459_c0_g1_i1.p1  ORF type:complete len:1727 (-),score=475.66 TRINITY_DN15459_c0_g1_i1:61-5241(-)